MRPAISIPIEHPCVARLYYFRQSSKVSKETGLATLAHLSNPCVELLNKD
jgi:hypothetical protein